MTIRWHTDAPASSVVEYEPASRLGAYAYDERRLPTYPLRVEDPRPTTVHVVTVEGLQAEWEYFYRVSSAATGSAPAVSPGASFFTAVRPDSPFRFATYGDSLRAREAHRRNAALARTYRAMFCVGAGDHAQDVSGRYFSDFFPDTRDLLPYTPWFAAMGNHDSTNEGYYRYFSFPEPHYWYAFDYGCAHFTVLNSNLDYRPGSEQWLWLEDDLRQAQASRWRFVFIHHPPYCSNDYEIPQTRCLCPLFERSRVHLVYSAHATLYHRTYPLTGGRYDGTAGVVYLVAGGGGYHMTLPPSQLWAHLHPTTALARACNHFLLTSVTPDECCVRAIDVDDRLFDMFSLRHTEPFAQPTSAPAATPAIRSARPERPLHLAGCDEDPVSWVFPPSQFAADADVTRSGWPSLRWHRSTPGPCLPALRRVLKDEGRAYEAVAGKAYELSAWVKTDALTGGVCLALEWNGDMGFMSRVTSPPLAGTRTWTRLSLAVPPLPRYIYACRIVLTTTPGSTGTAWFDDVRLIESSGDD